MTSKYKPPKWWKITEALSSPEVSSDDKVKIAAAMIEEEALMRTMELIHGRNQAIKQYIVHGGRFRFTPDGKHLMVEVPVRDFAGI